MLISIMVFSGIPPFWSTCEERTVYESSKTYSTVFRTSQWHATKRIHTLSLSQWIRCVTLDRAKTSLQ